MFEREKFKAKMISSKCYREVCKIERLVNRVASGKLPLKKFVTMAKKGIAKNGHDPAIVDKILALQADNVGFSRVDSAFQPARVFSRNVSGPRFSFFGRLPVSNRVVANRRMRLFSDFSVKLPRFSFFGKRGWL